MLVGNLLNLMNDAADILELFDNIDTREQLVSRLDQLKRRGTDDLLADLAGLRQSLKVLANDTLEVGTAVDVADDSGGSDEIDALLDDVADGKTTSEETSPVENTEPPEKTSVQSP